MKASKSITDSPTISNRILLDHQDSDRNKIIMGEAKRSSKKAPTEAEMSKDRGEDLALIQLTPKLRQVSRLRRRMTRDLLLSVEKEQMEHRRNMSSTLMGSSSEEIRDDISDFSTSDCSESEAGYL
jgi:hypothetical protein